MRVSVIDGSLDPVSSSTARIDAFHLITLRTKCISF